MTRSKSKPSSSAMHGSHRVAEEIDELAHGVTTTADALEIVDKNFSADTLMPSQYMDMVQITKFERDEYRGLKLFFGVLVEALNRIGNAKTAPLLAVIADYNRSLAICPTVPLLPPKKNSALRNALIALVWLHDDTTDDAEMARDPKLSQTVRDAAQARAIMSAANVCEWLEIDLAILRTAVVKAIHAGKRYKLRYLTTVTRRNGQQLTLYTRRVDTRGRRVKNRREGKFHQPIVKHHDRQSVQV